MRKESKFSRRCRKMADVWADTAISSADHADLDNSAMFAKAKQQVDTRKYMIHRAKLPTPRKGIAERVGDDIQTQTAIARIERELRKRANESTGEGSGDE